MIDRVCFLAAGVSAVLLAWLVLREGLTSGVAQVWLYLVFWLVLAYVALPRLHRILTGLYVPGYFVGRTRTSDGLLGDPVNLALLGSREQVAGAFAAAGWVRAEPTTPASSWRIVTAAVTGRSYPEAPVSPLLLFDRPQDVAYQQEVAGSPARRHHVRLWRCPDDWALPGGRVVDWLAAATYDRSVGLSLFTLQVTHRISDRVDEERDHVAGSLRASVAGTRVEVFPRFSVGYRNRNGGGDEIQTDGDLTVIDLTTTRAPTLDPAPTRRADGRGVARAAGLLLVGRALLEAATLLPGSPVGTLPGLTDPPPGLVLAVAAVTALVGLGVAAGREAARTTGLALALGGVVASTWAYVVTGVDSGLRTDLLGLSLDILVLVALTGPAVRGSMRPVSSPGRRGSPSYSPRPQEDHGGR